MFEAHKTEMRSPGISHTPGNYWKNKNLLKAYGLGNVGY